MICLWCKEFHTSLDVTPSGRMLCTKCADEEYCRCTGCRRLFEDRVKDGVGACDGSNWKCWDCMILAHAADTDHGEEVRTARATRRQAMEATWLRNACGYGPPEPPEPDFVPQVCTVTFEEIEDAA